MVPEIARPIAVQLAYYSPTINYWCHFLQLLHKYLVQGQHTLNVALIH